MTRSPQNKIELLKIKKYLFALVFSKKPEPRTNPNPVLKKHPGFEIKKDMMWKIHHLYNEIRQMKSLSIEDIYSTLGVDLEPTDSVKCVHRRNHIKGYREEIAKILTISMNQIELNVDRVNICKVTHKIFQSMQAFSQEKPHYIASQWFLGNSPDKNEDMKIAYERYTLASSAEKNDPTFCLKTLKLLLECTRDQVLCSFRTLYLDNILDHIYQWYFIYSESSYEFLIFMPDAFDDIRDFLLDIIDKNPFACYLKIVDEYPERINDNECCLDADELIYLSMDMVNQLASVRDLNRKFNIFYQNLVDFKEHGIFDCECYDLTNYLPPSILKNPSSRCKAPAMASAIISSKQVLPIFTYQAVVSERQAFIRQIVKKDLVQRYFTTPDGNEAPLIQQNLFPRQKKSS